MLVKSNKHKISKQFAQKILSTKQKLHLKQHQKDLPIFTGKDKILETIQNNEVTIIIGETGCGKSTQLPQYLLDAPYDQSHAMCAITQPRRVAAIALATRVAYECESDLGDKVGYTIRFKDYSSRNKTKIKYMTDGILLREYLMDEYLSCYHTVIVDEAHERSVSSDVLLGILKKLILSKERKTPLKLIVMSATLDAELFSSYFHGAPILYVAGRQHPVKVYHTLQAQDDYLEAVLITIFQIHHDYPMASDEHNKSVHDILVFLTGQEEIEAIQKLVMQNVDVYDTVTMQKGIQQNTSLNNNGSPSLLVCTMYAQMPAYQQMKAFNPAPKGVRKVILATNIAEASVTVPGIKYVIDTGLVKVRGYDPKIGTETLTVQPISKSAARQRLGRSGRESSGCCFRLYTEGSFENLQENSESEIRHCNLSSIVLMLKAFRIHDVLSFDFIEPPSRTGLKCALEELYALGALTETQQLSPLGVEMAKYPLYPFMAKILIKSKEFQCTSHIFSMLALLSVDGAIFFAVPDKKDQCQKAKKCFDSPDGDHCSLLNVYNSFINTETSLRKQWCSDHFINFNNMKSVLKIRKQLADIYKSNHSDYQLDNSDLGSANKLSQSINYDSLLRCLLTGLFRQVAIYKSDADGYRTLLSNQLVHIHPTSVLHKRRVPAVIFQELTLTTRPYMRTVSVINQEWLLDAYQTPLSRTLVSY